MSDIKVDVNSQNLTSIRVGQQNTTKVDSSVGGLQGIQVNVNPQNLTSIRVGQQNATKVVSSVGGLQGIQGLQGLQGIYGSQGSQGTIGPVGSNAGRIFYFDKQSSDIGGYYKALEYPSLSGLSSTTVEIVQPDVPVLIDRFITDPNSPGVLSFPIGENLVTIHTKLFSPGGFALPLIVQYNLIISKCNFDGTGITTISSALSEPFSSTNLDEFIWNVTTQNAVVTNINDRIIFEFYVIGTTGYGRAEVYYGDQVQSFVRTTVSAGAIGPQGTQGLSGSMQGSQGTQGIQGVGSQGTQGLSGSMQGSQGTQGVGSQGTQGTQGLSNQGSQGTQGVEGIGSQGSQGIQGIGSQGTQGLSNQGSQGIQGLSNQGSQGTQGVGSQGTQGLSGNMQGSQGTQGLQGTQGTQGLQGTQGTQGVQGLQGTQGTQGTQGLQGTQGTQGLQGTQGTQGLQGTQGTQGTIGSQGTQGVQGLQGTQGTQGVQGTQGLQGLTGPISGSNTQVIFNNNNVSAGATNFVYIASSQNVGIGTTNPTTTLQVNGTTKVETSIGSTQSVWFTTLDSKNFSAQSVSLLVQPETAYTLDASQTVSKSWNGVVFSHALTSANGSYTSSLYGFSNVTNFAGTASTARLNGFGLYNAVYRNSTTDVSSYASNYLYGIFNNVAQSTNVDQSVVTGFAYGDYNQINISKATATNTYNTFNPTYVGTTANYSATSTNAYGSYNLMQVGAASGTGIGTITNYYGYYVAPTVALTGKLTNYYGLYLATPIVSGTLTNRYSIYSSDTSSPMYHAGNILVGSATSTGTASQRLQVTGNAYISGGIGVGVTDNTTAGSIVISNQFQSTQANSAADGGGQFYLNGSNGNRIDFNQNGIGAPTFSTRSPGTKITLYPNINSVAADYAIGYETDTLWNSVPNISRKFKWYAGITTLATLFGSGELVLGSTAITETASQLLQVTGGAYVSGNLGIGTTNPISKLDIVGNVRISGVTTITGNLNAAGNYYAKIARTGSDQTISNGIDTLIGFSVISDQNSWYSGITTRTTPTVAGTYNVTGMVNWQAGSITNNQTNIQLRKNGNTFAISQVGIQTFSYTMNVCGIVTMNGTTDYIDFTVYTSNPTSQAIRGTADGSWTKMEIFKIN